MAKVTVQSAIKHIEKHGALLVFPIKNRTEPLSLWSCFYPKQKMTWEWTDDVDDGVVALWHLRTELSLQEEVVYTKWFQGRATLISRELFSALLSIANNSYTEVALSRDAQEVLDVLEDNSPLPTKRLREGVELTGRENEGRFTKAMKQLWSRNLIIGYGEADEGGFPSLCVGATRVLREDIWDASQKLSLMEAWGLIDRQMPTKTGFRKHLQRLLSPATNRTTSG